MKCEKCEYYGGRDRDDGTVYCNFEDTDIEECPYEDVDSTDTAEQIKANGMKVNIDLGNLTTIINNTVNGSIDRIIKESVSGLISNEYKEIIKDKTEAAIYRILDKQVETFMQGNITIGGGWREPERTLTRSEYLTELVTKALSENFDGEKIPKVIKSEVESKINKFTSTVKSDINANIRSLFDDATKTALTENVVKMLMDNETYRRLQGSMQNLLN